MFINKELYQKVNNDLKIGEDVLLEYEQSMYFSFGFSSGGEDKPNLDRGTIKKIESPKTAKEFYTFIKGTENITTSGWSEFAKDSVAFAIVEILKGESKELRWVGRDKKTDFWSGYGMRGSLMTRKPIIKITWDKVCLADEKKKAIFDALSQVKNSKLIFDTWGFAQTIEKGRALAFLFYGLPGTGKTLTAQAIADYLNFDLLTITPTDLNDKYFGETEKRIREVFRKADSKTVILFDECDGLVMDRNKGSNIVVPHINQFIYDLEHFDGVCVFTTNNIDFIDKALERRLALKIEFENPTQDIRKTIWRKLIPDKCPLAKDVDFNFLAQFPVNGGHIKNIVLNAARSAAREKAKAITMSHFIEAVKSENNGIKGFNQLERKQAQ